MASPTNPPPRPPPRRPQSSPPSTLNPHPHPTPPQPPIAPPPRYPLENGKPIDFTAKGTAQETTVTGLSPSSYYVFTITSKSAKGSSAEPAVTFHSTPAPGQKEPAAPTAVKADAAGSGSVALQWNAPSGTEPDYYELG